MVLVKTRYFVVCTEHTKAPRVLYMAAMISRMESRFGLRKLLRISEFSVQSAGLVRAGAFASRLPCLYGLGSRVYLNRLHSK